jgi:uncharacterized protein YyaL (SSP411 family)
MDADSLNEEKKLEEGAFYVWKKSELQTLLGQDFELFSSIYNINEFGLWEHENYVLIQNNSLEKIAKQHMISLSELENKKKDWEKLLYHEREKRSKPRLDDKCITSWNGLMLKGFVDAYKALNNEAYLKIALQNADYILKNLWTPEGNLLHNYKNGKANINGYLEDYALVIDAFISLYEATLDEKWLFNSKQLTDYVFDYFYNENASFFTFTSSLDAPLIIKHFENEDNVIPASNSVMANNLFRLSIYFNHSYYEKVALKMLKIILPNIDYPSAFSNWLSVFLNFSEQNKELAICGQEAFTYVSKINQSYHPNIIIAGTKIPSTLPFLQDRFSEETTLFYLCQNKTCKIPSDNFNEIIKQVTF